MLGVYVYVYTYIYIYTHIAYKSSRCTHHLSIKHGNPENQIGTSSTSKYWMVIHLSGDILSSCSNGVWLLPNGLQLAGTSNSYKLVGTFDTLRMNDDLLGGQVSLILGCVS